jgi:hypothetical protein
MKTGFELTTHNLIMIQNHAHYLGIVCNKILLQQGQT